MTESLLSTEATEASTATRVLHVRTTLGLRQVDLARVLGVDKRTVRRWERGGVVRKVYLDRMDDMLSEHEGEKLDGNE